jgi:uncharacterized protein (TIGR02246 family)
MVIFRPAGTITIVRFRSISFRYSLTSAEITMRLTFVISIAAGLAIGLVCSCWFVLPVAQSQETKPAKVADKAKEPDELEPSATAFEAAFNKGDAAAIAAQFGENAEVVDEDGNVVQGREDIQARFAEVFQKYPTAAIAVHVTSIRKLSPDVAVEDGYSITTLTPDEPASRSPYTLVHLKRNGTWLIASVRDFPEETDATPHDHLKSLEWLLGDWVDQSGDSKVETSCKWSEDENYLMQEYEIKLRGGRGGRGMQRIGWDPVRKTIRAWAFDQSGGYSESTWTPVGEGWIIKSEGYTADGTAASVTRGQELMPDSAVRVVRRPPAPSTQNRRI